MLYFISFKQKKKVFFPQKFTFQVLSIRIESLWALYFILQSDISWGNIHLCQHWHKTVPLSWWVLFYSCGSQQVAYSCHKTNVSLSHRQHTIRPFTDVQNHLALVWDLSTAAETRVDWVKGLAQPPHKPFNSVLLSPAAEQ